MSKYTVELRHLIDTGYDLEMDEYPIFDESYRATLNAKILAHYRFNEIGAETSSRFVHYLKTTLAEVMPYYNQLYISAALTINPLYNFHQTEQTTREAAANSTGSNVTDMLTVGSDTPQSLLAAADITGNVYASRADRGSNSATSQQSTANLENYVRTVAGLSGVLESDALQSWRQSFLNIDLMVIHDLATCFMGVY